MLAITSPHDRLGIGGNNPPEPIGPDLFADSAVARAEPVMAALRQWLKDYPVVANEAEAREPKALKDRAERSLAAIEEERDAKVRPLNQAVAAINAGYHRVHNTNAKKPGLYDTLLAELKIRITRFMRGEEDRRQAAAEAARRAAAEAERKAREAEERERAAAADAAAGICDIDIAGAVEEADAAFAAFARADRNADRAERDAHVRIGGGIGRVMTMRSREILAVADWRAAIEEIGLTDTIRDAILTSARAWRSQCGELPAGITARHEHSV
jgi:hypothetical protein